MNESFYVVNRRRKEYLDPANFGHGTSLRAIMESGNGLLAGLAVLLVRGNSETHTVDISALSLSERALIGSWANGSNDIGLVGADGESGEGFAPYFEEATDEDGNEFDFDGHNLYELVPQLCQNLSDEVMRIVVKATSIDRNPHPWCLFASAPASRDWSMLPPWGFRPAPLPVSPRPIFGSADYVDLYHASTLGKHIDYMVDEFICLLRRYPAEEQAEAARRLDRRWRSTARVPATSAVVV